MHHNGVVLCRFILGGDVAGASTGGHALHERLACLLCSRVLGCLAAVISQARRLTPKEQVPALPFGCDHGRVSLYTFLDSLFHTILSSAPAARHWKPL